MQIVHDVFSFSVPALCLLFSCLAICHIEPTVISLQVTQPPDLRVAAGFSFIDGEITEFAGGSGTSTPA